MKGELTPFGRLMAFNLVMDKNTGYSKVRLPSRTAMIVWPPCSAMIVWPPCSAMIVWSSCSALLVWPCKHCAAVPVFIALKVVIMQKV